MKPAFYHILFNSIIVGVANTFLWSSIIYWVYLETYSVLATSIIGGTYLVLIASSGIWFGSLVDHYRKKQVMLMSSLATLTFLLCVFVFFVAAPGNAFHTIESPALWIVVFGGLLAVICGNIRNIALPTVTVMLVEEGKRDKANGLVGAVMGLSFAISNVGAGFALAFAGLTGVLLIAIGATVFALIHLASIPLPEKKVVHAVADKKRVDLKGTYKVVKAVPGLLGLIFFTTFNNFLGGVFMSIMDAYGLTLVSVQVWGTLWGFLSFGFIFGGAYIAKFGLGKNPVRTLFRTNIALWVICIFFTIQPSIVLLAVGIFIYVCLAPFVEASEHTIIQKVVPTDRLGRVFGFAQSIEQAASPVSAFLIGPVAQFIFIPFMTTGSGVNLIGDWFGVGPGRGLALVFVLAGILGFVATVIAANSRTARNLSVRYTR